MSAYLRFLLRAMQSIAIWIIAGNVLLSLLIVLDLTTGAGWGYPAWSLLLTVGMIALAEVIRRGATYALRRGVT